MRTDPSITDQQWAASKPWIITIFLLWGIGMAGYLAIGAYIVLSENPAPWIFVTVIAATGTMVRLGEWVCMRKLDRIHPDAGLLYRRSWIRVLIVPLALWLLWGVSSLF